VESIGCNSRIRIKVGIRGRIKSLYREYAGSGMICETFSDCKIRSSRSMFKKNVEAPVVSACDFPLMLVSSSSPKLRNVKPVGDTHHRDRDPLQCSARSDENAVTSNRNPSHFGTVTPSLARHGETHTRSIKSARCVIACKACNEAQGPDSYHLGQLSDLFLTTRYRQD
jgi:hypothetical protein